MKTTFKWAAHFDLGQADCGFAPETETVVLGDGYSFGDWLSDHGVRFNQDNDDPDMYFVLDNDLSADTRTGEAFMIVSTEPAEAAA